jgi:hypothetical protein
LHDVFLLLGLGVGGDEIQIPSPTLSKKHQKAKAYPPYQCKVNETRENGKLVGGGTIQFFVIHIGNARRKPGSLVLMSLVLMPRVAT